MTSFAMFDLDGTLLDSAPLCAHIINSMRTERGAASLVSLDDTRRYASLGGKSLVRGLLGEFGDDAEHDLADFRERYRTMPTPSDSLYPGVRHGLAKLHAQGCVLALCSNKPQPLCEKVLNDLGLSHIFDLIVGARPGLAPKPHPASLDLCLRGLGAARGDGCYVGDSELDYAAARSAGLRCVLVTYGYAIGGHDFDGAHLADDFGQAVSLVEDLLVLRRPERIVS